MSLLPVKFKFTIWEGSTWRKKITVLSGGPGSTPRDLTDYTGQMDIRTAPDTVPVYTLSTANSQITIDGPVGEVFLYIPAADTLTFDSWQNALYELTITDAGGSGDIESLLWGPITVRGIA